MKQKRRLESRRFCLLHMRRASFAPATHSQKREGANVPCGFAVFMVNTPAKFPNSGSAGP
jgi:hypothetical protein